MTYYPAHTPEDGQRLWDEIRQARAAAPLESPTVELSSLPTAQKRAVWRYLRARHPAYADLLQSPALQLMREHFDARVHIARDLVTEALLDDYAD